MTALSTQLADTPGQLHVDAAPTSAVEQGCNSTQSADRRPREVHLDSTVAPTPFARGGWRHLR
jgi:hypothetical protein